MTLFADVAAWSILAFALLLFLVQMLAHETGYRVGCRRAAQGDVQSEGVGAVVGGMLALLAFMLALTLSYANTRFSERRAGTLAETNAIGTAWLRAEAIGEPRGAEIARLLEEYTHLRIAFVRAGRDPAAIDEINRRTNALQSEIWGQMAAIVRARPDAAATSLMAALNETFDMTTPERFAYGFRLPPQIFWLLIGMALLGMGALGYQLGLRGHRVRLLVALLTVMWTVVIADILDLAAPRIGSFRTGTAVYEWTLRGFHGGVRIPPPASH